MTREPGDLPATKRNANGPRVEGERMQYVNTTINTISAAATPASRLFQLGLAALLGLFVIGAVGFAQMDVAHNAAHDYRHSMAFPCH
jgi:cobalt transporter subunit CbtB